MNTTVYYPYIEPPLEWLKVASLCWDRVHVLNTSAYGGDRPFHDPEVNRFDSALGGFVDRSLRVEDLVDDELVARFKKWVDSNEERLRSDGLSSTRQPLFGMYDSKFERANRSEESLRSWLIEKHLARIEEPDESGYTHWDPYLQRRRFTEVTASMFVRDTMVFLPQDIAFHYLSLCASKAALHGNRDLVAADDQFTDIVFHDVRSVRGDVARAVLEAQLPGDFQSLGLERIAEFRSSFAAQRLRYQAEIQSIVREFIEVASEDQLGAVKRRIIDVATQRVEEAKKSYKLAKLQTTVKALGFSLTPPSIAVSIASALGIGLFAPAGIAAALSLFGAELLIARQEAQAKAASSPWSYVLDAAKLV